MKVLTLLGAIFAAVGACLLTAAFIVYGNAQSFASSAESAEGVVVDLAYTSSSSGSSVAPVVRFLTPEAEEIVFQSSVSSNPPAYDIGEKVNVLYDPADPSDATIDSFWQQYLLPVILGGIGGVFFAIGGGMLLARALKRRTQRRLMLMGRRVTAKIQGVDLNTSVAVNGRHPFCITSQWLNPDTGQMHVFRSDGIWYDPSDHLNGDTIDVLVDPVNPNKYYVDTSFLPKEA